MKEITILSGKGGTGKTSLTSALSTIAKNAIFCDNDVNAADLHLIFNPDKKEEFVFSGAWIAKIDEEKCTNCGICLDHCRYDAISCNETSYKINPFKCDGCRLCERLCPSNAISSYRNDNSHWLPLQF